MYTHTCTHVYSPYPLGLEARGLQEGTQLRDHRLVAGLFGWRSMFVLSLVLAFPKTIHTPTNTTHIAQPNNDNRTCDQAGSAASSLLMATSSCVTPSDRARSACSCCMFWLGAIVFNLI